MGELVNKRCECERRARLLNVILKFTGVYACACILPVCLYEGKPAKLEDTNNPDWVPSLKMGYDVANSGGSLERYSRLQARCLKRRRADNSWCESETTVDKSNMTKRESGLSYFYK